MIRIRSDWDNNKATFKCDYTSKHSNEIEHILVVAKLLEIIKKQTNKSNNEILDIIDKLKNMEEEVKEKNKNGRK